eukprot:m.179287 g.179287  ORF g.179287 m.179287 type:complete len:235 (+) comp39215_c0_seq1:68-772(+)
MDLAQTTAQLTGAALTLIPFTFASIFYLLYWLPGSEDPSFAKLVFKCAPMLCLWWFVYRQGIHKSYNRRILGGLVFSCVGDGLLVYTNDYFIQGLLAFAVAHGLYGMAFGLRPFKAKVGAVLGVAALISYSFIYPNLKGILTWLCLFYSIMLMLMVWRALARAWHYVTKHNKHLPWATCLVIGVSLFWLSDLVLAWDAFRMHLPWGKYFVMVTYYAAQLGISLSVIVPKRTKEV